jgi:hypothetical protein
MTPSRALIVWDRRLLGVQPAGNEVVAVDQWTSIDQIIHWIGWKSDQYRGDVVLRVLAHGFHFDTGRAGPDGKHVFSPGGGGIQVGREGITLSTVQKFAALRGKLRKIELLGCAAAYITPGFEGREGDGNFLCYRLAQIAQTYVKASTADQSYESDRYSWHAWGLFPDKPIDFGPWEGTVITYGPTGGRAGLPWE